MTLIPKKPKKRTPQSKVVSVDSGLVKDILARNGYTITRAAKVLDMNPTYLSQRLKNGRIGLPLIETLKNRTGIDLMSAVILPVNIEKTKQQEQIEFVKQLETDQVIQAIDNAVDRIALVRHVETDQIIEAINSNTDIIVETLNRLIEILK